MHAAAKFPTETLGGCLYPSSRLVESSHLIEREIPGSVVLQELRLARARDSPLTAHSHLNGDFAMTDHRENGKARRAERTQQQIAIRTAIWTRLQEIVELIPTSPECTRALTRDVLEAIVLGVSQTVDAAGPLIAGYEGRLGNLLEIPLRRAKTQKIRRD
jgi:hypothetical protein